MDQLISAASDAEKLGLIGVLFFMVLALGGVVVYLFKTCCQKRSDELINYLKADHGRHS